jgi:hypothetical protein
VSSCVPYESGGLTIQSAALHCSRRLGGISNPIGAEHNLDKVGFKLGFLGIDGINRVLEDPAKHG